MVSPTTKVLVAGASLFGGILAGVTANRALVQLPAWEKIGLIPWASFTQAENSGVGSIFYPALGFAAILFTLGAAVALRLDRAASGWPRLAIYLAALLTVVWAVVTRTLLVPAMLGLRATGNDIFRLQQLFSAVERWSAVNDVLHVITFCLNLWALTAALSTSSPPAQPDAVST